MIKIELSNKTIVEIVDQLTWGMQEEIRDAMLSGLKISGLTEKDKQNIELDTSVINKAKYKSLELCIKKITDIEGNDIPYSREWMNGLSISDGDKIVDAVNKVTNEDTKKK